jgi:hypothetical protein
MYGRVMPATKTRGRKPGSKMTAEHKAALAQGREESRAVKAYLEILDAAAPKKRGRKRTPESIAKRLTAIDKAILDANVLTRLQLLQEKADLEAEAAAMSGAQTVDTEAARSAFVKVAKSYSQRKGITYSTWRAAGVDAATLKEAGVTRSGS